VEFLRNKARVMKSHALDRLAQEIQAHANGPFDDMAHAMERMIWRLQQEQTEENEHKQWCDKELSKTSIAKNEKDDKLEAASEKLGLAKARIQQLTHEIAESEKMVADITDHFGQAEIVRQAGRKENMEAIADAELAQKALSNAIAVLNEFYKGSGMIPKEAWESLVQISTTSLSGQPATWDAEYTGSKLSAGSVAEFTTDPAKQQNGIIGVLEEVSADFARMLADTKAQEEADKKDYAADISDSKIEQARRRQSVEVKDAEKKREIDKLAEMEGDVKHRQAEVSALVKYFEDLEHTCHGGESTYEDRKEARQDEMSALKDAEKILRDGFENKRILAPAGHFERHIPSSLACMKHGLTSQHQPLLVERREIC